MKKIRNKFIKVLIIVTSVIFVTIFLTDVKVYTIISGSMHPTIKIGDVAVVKQQENYKINDVITYKLQDTTVTHRIVAVKKNGYVTKGDFNKVNDVGIVSKDMVVGKVILVIPAIGLLFIYVKEYYFIVIATILLLYITIKITDKVNKRKGD